MARGSTNGLSVIGRFLLLAIIIMTVLGAAFLGPSRAMRIGVAAASYEFFDRRIPLEDQLLTIVDIETAEEPDQSYIPATWKQNGIAYPVEIRRSASQHPADVLSSKGAYHVRSSGQNPYRPLRSFSITNPRSLNMLNNHLALWTAGFAGVAVPFDELVVVRLNGNVKGVMELCESADEYFEEVRNITSGPIPHFISAAVDSDSYVWKDESLWERQGQAHTPKSETRFRSLIELIRRGEVVVDSLPISYADSLAKLVDMEDMARYYAVLKILDVQFRDVGHRYHLNMNERGLFYPILTQEEMMFPHETGHWFPVHDALAFRLMSIPEFRMLRDRHIHETVDALLNDSAFFNYFGEVRDKLRPSLLSDKQKEVSITNMPNDVFRYSSLHAARSSDRLLQRSLDHWQSLREGLKVSDLKYSARDTILRVSWNGQVPVRLQLEADSTPKPLIHRGSRQLEVTTENGYWSCDLIPRVSQRGSNEADPTGSWLETIADESVLTTDIPIKRIRFINAITNETIETK